LLLEKIMTASTPRQKARAVALWFIILVTAGIMVTTASFASASMVSKFGAP
jgi:hypothetical protein